jgi:predicted XRE-type DNA-binding protein
MSKDHQVGSSNVFDDLGLHNSEERLVKAKIALFIKDFIDAKKLTQNDAATLLGVDQPKVSALTRGKLSGFTLERLISFVIRIDCDVDLIIKDRPWSHCPPPHFQVFNNTSWGDSPRQ